MMDTTTKALINTGTRTHTPTPNKTSRPGVTNGGFGPAYHVANIALTRAQAQQNSSHVICVEWRTGMPRRKTNKTPKQNGSGVSRAGG